MHEMSIAVALLEQALEIAAENKVKRIERLDVEAGALRQIVPDILEMSFATISEGTPAEGACLVIREKKARARCRRCQKFFQPEPGDFRCDVCQTADAEVLEGDQIILQSLTADSA